jgi:hypothetical protein
VRHQTPVVGSELLALDTTRAGYSSNCGSYNANVSFKRHETGRECEKRSGLRLRGTRIRTRTTVASRVL